MPVFLLLEEKVQSLCSAFQLFVLRLNNIWIAPFWHAQTILCISHSSVTVTCQRVLSFPQNSWMQFSFHYLQKCNTKPPFMVLFSLINQIWRFMLYSCHGRGCIFYLFLINDRCFENSYLLKGFLSWFWDHKRLDKTNCLHSLLKENNCLHTLFICLTITGKHSLICGNQKR